MRRRVDPGDLRLPPDRVDGPDELRLADQIRDFGATADGTPLWVTVGADGEMMISNGVTRAYRIYSLAPDLPVDVEIVEETDFDFSHLPWIRDIAV